MKTFSGDERKVKKLLSIGNEFDYNGVPYKIDISDKPTCRDGEPKTDIYVHAVNEDNKDQEIELKITFKKENADFIENKIKEQRAEQIFGPEWKLIIKNSTEKLRHQFLAKQLIYQKGYRRTQAGSITLGWKFELLNKPGGDLSGLVPLSNEQLFDIYAGNNLDMEKKDAKIIGETVKNSGVANFILVKDSIESTQDIINNLEAIEEYIQKYPSIFFACKALNYRSFSSKWDGNRPLAVYIKWEVINAKLTPSIIFDNPLAVKGDEVCEILRKSMKSMGIQTTDDINQNNISDPKYIYFK